MKTFQSKRWGEVEVLQRQYHDKTLAILLVSKDEPLATLSVNLGKHLPERCFHVKTWLENEELAEEAFDSGLFKDRVDLPAVQTGFVLSPVWEILP